MLSINEANINTVNCNSSFINFVKTHKQLHNCCFTRTGWTNNCNLCSVRNVYIKVIEDFCSWRIRKIDMLEIYIVCILLGYVVVVSMGAFMTIAGFFTIGDIQAFIQYVNTFSKPLSQLLLCSGKRKSRPNHAQITRKSRGKSTKIVRRSFSNN